MNNINQVFTVLENIESTEVLSRKTELDKKIAQFEEHVRCSRKQAYYFLMIFLKEIRSGFSHLYTSWLALRWSFGFLPKIVILRVKRWRL